MEWKASACVGCGACVEAAPAAGEVERADRRHVDVRELAGETAAAAVAACPMRALTLVGETRTTDEVLRTCLQDKPFYDDSGGGVTLSGGEALTWPDFDVELLCALHAEGVNTCVETEGHVAPAAFRRVAAHLDHILFDLKHVNRAKHLAATGVDGTLMLENLAWAVGQGMDVLPRTPVIPGFNDSTDEARAMARKLVRIGASRVQLLPFHNFGEGKYELLDQRYRLAGVPNLHPEDLEAYRQAYLDEGVEAFF